MSGDKVIEYIIKAKDATTDGVKSATSSVKGFASSVATNLANIKAGFDMVKGVVTSFAGIFKTAISEAFKFEKVQSDFTGLLNSVDAAKEHIADLKNFASSTPLTFDDLSQASKLLLSFGVNVDEVMPSLKTLGDIAMGNNEKFQGLALVFAQVKSAGKLMGQDLMQMINQGFNPLTVIAQETGKSMSELKDIMADGGISFEMVAEAMRVATSEGGLFNDAMANAAQTGQGLVSTLQDKWTEVVRTFGEQLTETSKGGLQLLIDTITRLMEDGTIDVWADKCGSALKDLVEMAESCAKAIGKVVDAYETVKNWGASVGSSVGGFFGTLFGGGSLSDAVSAASSASNSTIQAQVDAALEEQEHENTIRAAAKARANTGTATVAEQAASAKSLATMFAEAEQTERLKVEEKVAAHRDTLMKTSATKYGEELKAAQTAVAKAQSEAAAAKSNAASATQKTDSLLSAASSDDISAAYKNYKANTREGQYETYLSLKNALETGVEGTEFEDQFKTTYNNGRNWKYDQEKMDNAYELVQAIGAALEEEDSAQQYAQETAQKAADAVAELEKLNAQLENGRGE